MAKILQYRGCIAICSDGSKWFAGIMPGSEVEVMTTNMVTKICIITETISGAHLLLSYSHSCFIGKAANKEAGKFINIKVNIKGLMLFL